MQLVRVWRIWTKDLIIENSTLNQSTTWPLNHMSLLELVLLHWTYKIHILTCWVKRGFTSLPPGCNGVFSWGFFNRCCNRDMHGWRADCFSIKRGKMKECPFITTHYGFAVQVILVCYIYLSASHNSEEGLPTCIKYALRFKADFRCLLPTFNLGNEWTFFFFFLTSVSPGPWVSA